MTRHSASTAAATGMAEGGAKTPGHRLALAAKPGVPGAGMLLACSGRGRAAPPSATHAGRGLSLWPAEPPAHRRLDPGHK
jgi:hypothetical protein